MDVNYRLPAGLFAPDHRQTLVYLRFTTLAEAIRFVVEELSPADQMRAFMDLGDETLFATAIRELYESANYPLRRTQGRLAPEAA
jgi:hypothetical protein